MGFKTGSHVVWGVNLGANNITAASLQTRSIIKAFSSPAMKAAEVTLDCLEIGNEADLYKNNGQRPTNWTVNEYVPKLVPALGFCNLGI